MAFRIYAEFRRWQADRPPVNLISRIRHLISEQKPDFHTTKAGFRSGL